MLKTIVFCALLTGCALSAEQTFERPNIKVLELLHSRNLFTVKLNQHLYSLTWKNNTHLRVFSTNRTEATEACTFDARKYPFDQLDSHVVLNTAVLGDNQTIAVVGFRYHLYDKHDKLHRYAYYDIFLLDLIDCTFKDVETAHLSKVPISYQEHQPQIVAQNDKFDVYFDSEKPYRYSIQGKKVNTTLERKLMIDFDEEFESFHVRLLDPVDTKRNYLYVHNFRNGTSVMKVLNKDFHLVSKRLVDYKVKSLSVNKDVGSPIGICYFKNDDRNLYCERLDVNLKTISDGGFRVPVRENDDIFNVTLTLDNLGNTFVGVLYSRFQSSQKRLYVFRFDSNGHLTEADDLGNVDNGNTNLLRDRVVQIDSYIVEGLENQYCIVAYEVLGATKDHNYTHMKCFQAPKYNKNEK